MFGVSLSSQLGQCACWVMPGFGWAVGVCTWQSTERVAQIRDAMMLLGDVVEVWLSQGQVAQTKAKLRPEGRTGAESQL